MFQEGAAAKGTALLMAGAHHGQCRAAVSAGPRSAETFQLDQPVTFSPAPAQLRPCLTLVCTALLGLEDGAHLPSAPPFSRAVAWTGLTFCCAVSMPVGDRSLDEGDDLRPCSVTRR